MTGAGLRPLRSLVRQPLLLLLALLLPAACTPLAPYPLPERPDIPFGQGRIWQIDGAGATPSYVFGTMHVDDKRVLELPPAAETAFADAEIAAFELLDDPNAAEAFDAIERYKLTGEETLEDLLGSRSYGILRWHLKRRDLVPNRDIKPWVFWKYMGGHNWGFVDYDRLDPSGHGKILDSWLEDRARKAGKEVVALETYQEHFDIYDRIPLDQQADMLKLTLEQYADSKPWVPKLQLYLDGDLAMFDALWREYLSWLPPATAETVDRQLITGRNRVMVERMIPLMRRGSTFVAIGAGHLAGEEGVLYLLAQQGFSVSRLH